MKLRKTLAKTFNFLLVFFAVCYFASCTNEVVIIYDLSQKRFEALLDDCEKKSISYIIIDIRSKKEYDLGHIEDAMSYPMDVLPNEFYDFEDYANEMVFVYGHNLEESFKATKFLAENNFKKLYNMSGIDEAEYDLILHEAVRLEKGFNLAASEGYQLVDYRRSYVRNQYFVANTCFVPYPELTFENFMPYNEKGYVVFSTAKKTAKECAAELVEHGFKNVYYCIDNIINYNKFFTTNLETNITTTNQDETNTEATNEKSTPEAEGSDEGKTEE